MNLSLVPKKLTHVLVITLMDTSSGAIQHEEIRNSTLYPQPLLPSRIVILKFAAVIIDFQHV
jgi:hypothetical protein